LSGRIARQLAQIRELAGADLALDVFGGSGGVAGVAAWPAVPSGAVVTAARDCSKVAKAVGAERAVMRRGAASLAIDNQLLPAHLA
jgi:hypothetical protein